MHDSTLQIIGMDVNPTEDHMQLVFTTALAIPVGPGQVMPVADGVYRVPMRKETAIDFANKILEEANNLPDSEQPKPKADILLANNMGDVANVARQTEQFKGRHGS